MEDRIVGYWWEYLGDEPYETTILKKSDNKFYRQSNGEDDVFEDQIFPKEMFQWAITNPWDEMHFSKETKDQQIIASYVSIMDDWFACRICGFGKNENDAMVQLIQNIIDIMSDYNEEKVETYMSNLPENWREE